MMISVSLFQYISNKPVITCILTQHCGTKLTKLCVTTQNKQHKYSGLDSIVSSASSYISQEDRERAAQGEKCHWGLEVFGSLREEIAWESVSVGFGLFLRVDCDDWTERGLSMLLGFEMEPAETDAVGMFEKKIIYTREDTSKILTFFQTLMPPID